MPVMPDSYRNHRNDAKINFEIRYFLLTFVSRKMKGNMEKNYTINYGYRNGNSQYRYEVRITCKESEVEGIARAVAKGNNADFCYAEGENGYRLVVCDCM